MNAFFELCLISSQHSYFYIIYIKLKISFFYFGFVKCNSSTVEYKQLFIYHVQRPTSPSPKKFPTRPSVGKVMAAAFYDS